MVDQDQDQHITWYEFATIIDIYQNGSTDEKNEFSFSLFDEDQDGYVSLEDMYIIMKKIMSHWSTLQGSDSRVDKDALEKIFKSIDIDGDGHVTLEEYKEVLRQNPGLFRWFDILNNNSSINDEEEEQEKHRKEEEEK